MALVGFVCSLGMQGVCLNLGFKRVPLKSGFMYGFYGDLGFRIYLEVHGNHKRGYKYGKYYGP